MILVSQFPERQLLEYKKIFQCIKMCFLKRRYIYIYIYTYFFLMQEFYFMVCLPVNFFFLFFFFRSQQYQEMSFFYSQILTSSYWIGSTLSKMQLTDCQRIRAVHPERWNCSKSRDPPALNY